MEASESVRADICYPTNLATMELQSNESEKPDNWIGRKDFWLLGAIAVVLVAGTIFVSLKLLDQSERHVKAVKEMKVREDVDNAWAPQKAQCDSTIKADLEAHPDRTEAKYTNMLISEKSMLYLAKMSKLQGLSLSGCSVEDRWLRHLAPLPLQRIALSDCDITDDAMNYLVKMKDLKAVHLNGCTKITDRGVEIITKRPLTELFVAKSRITNESARFLSSCKTLRRLDVGQTSITSDVLAQLLSLKELVGLDLSDTLVRGKDLGAVKNADKLRALNLRRCGVNDDGLKTLTGVGVYKINLSGNPFSGKGLAYLYSCPQLGVLKLDECPNITAADVQKFKKAKPNCRVDSSDPDDQWREAVDSIL